MIVFLSQKMYFFLYNCSKLDEAYYWMTVLLNVEKYVGLQIVEAYLSMEQVTCNQLQLFGITAVLLATRCVCSSCECLAHMKEHRGSTLTRNAPQN